MTRKLCERLMRINALYPVGQEWKWTTAKEDLIGDEFLYPIKKDEYYFIREIAEPEDHILSQQSLNTLYECLFGKNSLLRSIYRDAIRQRIKDEYSLELLRGGRKKC